MRDLLECRKKVLTAQSKDMDPSLPPGNNLCIYSLAQDTRGKKRDMPQSTRSRKVWASLGDSDPPQAREAQLKFTGYLESSTQIYLKLSFRTGPSSPPLSSLMPDPAEKHVQHEFFQTSEAFRILMCLKSSLFDKQH